MPRPPGKARRWKAPDAATRPEDPDGRLDDHREAMTRTELLEQRHIARAVPAEAKIRADHEGARAVIEQRSQERLGIERGELARERLHQHVVGAGGAQ